MNKYLIDFQKMINWLLPVRKRKDTRKSFLYAGMKWIRDIHAEFITFGTSLKSEALINSQVTNFQNYLQDRFGDGILIVHDSISPSLLGEVIDTLIVAGDDGDATTWIGDANDGGLTGVTFIVQVPNALVYDQDELRAVINKYKVPGSNYIIEEI